MPSRPDTRMLARMLLSLGLVALSYVAVAAVLLWLHVPWPVTAVALVVAAVAHYVMGTRGVALGLARHAASDSGAEGNLRATVDRLCALSGVSRPRLVVVESDVPNAFAYGRPRNATLCVTRGLLATLEPVELETVLAHEMAHVAHRDALVMNIASFLSMATAQTFFLLDVVLGAVERGLRAFDERHGVGLVSGTESRPGATGKGWATLVLFPATAVLYLGGGVFMIAFAIVAGVLALLGLLIVSPLSKSRELAADHAAARLTGRPSALASALLKVSDPESRIPDLDRRLVRHVSTLCIVPFSEGHATPAARSGGLMDSHPAVGQRVDHLQELSRELSG